jgi:hypothetical protein
MSVRQEKEWIPGECLHSINIVLSGSWKTGMEDLNLELTKSGKEKKDQEFIFNTAFHLSFFYIVCS